MEATGENIEEHKIDKISTPTNRRFDHNNRIYDARSESRKEFTKISFKDAKPRLQEIPHIQAKERRQKKINENREKRINEENKNELESSQNRTGLIKMIKEIRQLLEDHMRATELEIENIKKMIDINYKIIKKENIEVNNFKESTEMRLQNIINAQKEMYLKHESLESYAMGIVENKCAQTTNKDSYTKFKNELKVKASQNNYNFIHTAKAILYDKYNFNKARVVTMKDNHVKVYQVSISYRNYRKTFYIKYQNHWCKLRDVLEQLRAEGLIYGFKNIVKTLRNRNIQRNSGRFIKSSNQNKTQEEKEQIEL